LRIFKSRGTFCFCYCKNESGDRLADREKLVFLTSIFSLAIACEKYALKGFQKGIFPLHTDIGLPIS